MSCWIIEDKTLNKLVRYFIKCSYSEYTPYCQIKTVLNKLGYDLNYDYETDENPHANRLLNDLNILNIKSVNNNYNLKEDDKRKELFFNEDTKTEKNIYQILKSVECLHYQCLDINENEKEKYKNLLKGLKDISKILTSHIINSLEEYKKAKWE